MREGWVPLLDGDIRVAPMIFRIRSSISVGSVGKSSGWLCHKRSCLRIAAMFLVSGLVGLANRSEYTTC